MRISLRVGFGDPFVKECVALDNGAVMIRMARGKFASLDSVGNGRRWNTEDLGDLLDSAYYVSGAQNNPRAIRVDKRITGFCCDKAVKDARDVKFTRRFSGISTASIGTIRQLSKLFANLHAPACTHSS